MEKWLAEYTIKIETEQSPQTDPAETALSFVRDQLVELQMQQDKICEYLEKGVYTVEMFTKRNDTLTREIQKQRAAESDLLKKQSSQSETKSAEAEIIPTTQHILACIAPRLTPPPVVYLINVKSRKEAFLWANRSLKKRKNIYVLVCWPMWTQGRRPWPKRFSI